MFCGFPFFLVKSSNYTLFSSNCFLFTHKYPLHPLATTCANRHAGNWNQTLASAVPNKTFNQRRGLYNMKSTPPLMSHVITSFFLVKQQSNALSCKALLQNVTWKRFTRTYIFCSLCTLVLSLTHRMLGSFNLFKLCKHCRYGRNVQKLHWNFQSSYSVFVILCSNTSN